ncbi:MAG TPA: hypothetical protein VER36_03785 [Flavisolibacter sp.]|nr:hypothetical protein [Flavisolibacter sp.]
MKNVLTLSLLLLLFSSCAKIPVQSIALAEALQEEGERMHKLNLVFLNRIFLSKRVTIEKFIEEQYTPKAVAEFTSRVSKEFPQTDFKKEFPELMNALLPQINTRRDSLVRELELQKEKVVDKLNTDYKVFNNAASELKKLLESAVKVDKEKQALFNQAKALSNNRIDFNQLEGALDKFILSGGNVGNNIAELNNAVNQLLTNK